ncbi:hypothetical protein SASPL_141315 [Salvia splendens]|uniref:Uncharacterized protein n=1 Tax=Salvia splendens TaxID=180675 RepID=A0A8X8WSS5_SALSN|nr:hypothetical protein SASPL_141315 [Salvia splendens]
MVVNDVIIQRDPSACAYYHRDEPEFCLLASLFGLTEVKDEFPREVITLSDTTEVIVLTETVEPNAPVRVCMYQSPTDSDEVNSPMSGPSTRVRRKLFDVGAPCFDGTTSNKPPNRYTPPNKDVLASPKASSCASWSPFPASRKPAP